RLRRRRGARSGCGPPTGSPSPTMPRTTCWCRGRWSPLGTPGRWPPCCGTAPPRGCCPHLTKAGKRPAAPDRVARKFTAVAPNVLWCGDLTEVDTDEGKLYLATVLDLFSRRMLGYAMSEHHDAALAKASLSMAAASRGGTIGGVIFHSDRGSEYTAEAFEAACRKLGVLQSMGRVGSALDNAAAE